MTIPNRKRKWCDRCRVKVETLAREERRNLQEQRRKAEELRGAVYARTRR